MSEKLPYRVLILPSWYLPDGGTFFRDHAEALNSKDFEVHILVNRTITFTANTWLEILSAGRKSESSENGVMVLRRSTLKFPGFEEWNLNRWIRKYIGFFEQYRKKYGLPDIMIVQSSLWAGAVAARLKLAYRIPYILVEHRGRFTEHLELTEEYFEKWYLNYLKGAFTNANRIVCVSDALKHKISTISQVPVSEIMTIPNLVDTKLFCPPVNPRQTEPFVFLSAGFFDMVKGFDILLEAFAIFLEKNEGEFFLRIAGSGKDGKKLKNYAAELGIDDRVSFLGKLNRERLRDEMQRSNVFVLPSRFESFGVVLIESLATGSPVIATRSGGPETIVNEKNGLLVPVENEEELADAMTRMYQTWQNYDPENVRKFAVDHYSHEHISESYRELIRDTLHEYSIIE